MATKYVTPKQFQKLSKGKEVKNFPNEWIKEIAGTTYQIIDPNLVCECSKLEHDKYSWYLGFTYEAWKGFIKGEYNEDDADIYILTCDWFPRDLIAGTMRFNLGHGIIRNGYSMNTVLSKRTGWIQPNYGTLGSRSEPFRASKINDVIAILNKNGFNFKVA